MMARKRQTSGRKENIVRSQKKTLNVTNSNKGLAAKQTVFNASEMIDILKCL